jgi:Bifunctional DNA primase/polymerase, N-terminal
MPTRQERMGRVMTGMEHRGTDRQQTGRDPNDDHGFSFYQVAVLLADEHRVAVVPSHGLKKNRCTCGERDCERPGAHPRTPHELQDATTDLRLIGQFWEKWPKAKVIIATGLEGVIAVTVKGSKGKRALKTIFGEEDEASLETLQFFDRGVRTYVWRTAAEVIPEAEVQLADGLTGQGCSSGAIQTAYSTWRADERAAGAPARARTG